MAMAEMEDVPLVSEEKIPSNRRRLMMVVGAITFLMATTLSVSLGYVYFHKQHFRIRAGDPSHSKVAFPNQKDVKKLLELLQETYPDPQIVFKELQSLNVDNSDPENIKFTPKDWKPPNITQKNQKSQQLRSRRLQEFLPDQIDTPMDYDYFESLNLALCVIDGYQSALTIGQIATNIHSVTIACESPYPKDPQQQDFCAQMVSLNLALWGYLACFIEDMVSACGPEFNLNAGCSLDVTGLLTNSFLASSAGAGMKQNCLPPGGYKGTTPAPEVEVDTDPVARTFGATVQDDIEDFLERLRKRQEERERERTERFKRFAAVGAGSRRLDEIANLPVMPLMKQEMDSQADSEYLQKRAQETIDEFLAGNNIKDKEAAKRQLKLTSEELIQLKKDNDEKKWKKAACGLDTQKAAARIAQAAVMMAFAVKDCSVENFMDKGQAGKNKCAVDITAAIASAGIAASLITISVINCPASLEFTEIMGKRFCAASIIDLVVATSYIGTSIASIQGTCGTLDNAWET